MNIAIIPARGGSTRIPGKNKRLFHGKPIIAYSIETAKASKLFDEIIVSTDDADIVRIAKGYGAKVHMRPASYCRNEIGTQDVVKVALHWWNVCHPKRRPSNVCCIYATAPLMTGADLRAGLRLLEDADEPYVYSVGLNLPVAEDTNPKPIYFDAGQWYWGRHDAFINGVPLEGNSQHWALPPERVCDINTEADWQRAELLYKQMKERNDE